MLRTDYRLSDRFRIWTAMRQGCIILHLYGQSIIRKVTYSWHGGKEISNRRYAENTFLGTSEQEIVSFISGVKKK